MSIKVYPSSVSTETEIHFTISDHVHERVVSVVGSFNDWTPGVDVFTVRPDGTRVAVVTVSGLSEVRFRYLGSGGVWFDDAAADEIDDQGCLLISSPAQSATWSVMTSPRTGRVNQSAVNRDRPPFRGAVFVGILTLVVVTGEVDGNVRAASRTTTLALPS